VARSAPRAVAAMARPGAIGIERLLGAILMVQHFVEGPEALGVDDQRFDDEGMGLDGVRVDKFESGF